MNFRAIMCALGLHHWLGDPGMSPRRGIGWVCKRCGRKVSVQNGPTKDERT